jgi:hypothetical protein
MSAYLLMAKQVLANLSLWKADRYTFFSCRLHTSHPLISQTEDTTGMIPRAVSQVFKAADDLKSKGWEYKMDGQFLEIVRMLSLHRRDSIKKKMRSITKQSTTSLARVSSTRRSMRSSTTSPVLVSLM